MSIDPQTLARITKAFNEAFDSPADPITFDTFLDCQSAALGCTPRECLETMGDRGESAVKSYIEHKAMGGFE